MTSSMAALRAATLAVRLGARRAPLAAPAALAQAAERVAGMRAMHTVRRSGPVAVAAAVPTPAKRWAGAAALALATAAAAVAATAGRSPAAAQAEVNVVVVEPHAPAAGEAKTAPVVAVLSGHNEPMRDRMATFVKVAQANIVKGITEVEGGDAKFRCDHWQREQGGEGITCVLQDGKVFEKAAVNVSIVHGELPPEAVRQMNSRGKDIPVGTTSLPFFAAGISLVIHPVNPHAPTVHLNYRYFEVVTGEGKTMAWFGGGADLTPSYLYEEDAVHFHKQLKDACDRHDPSYYPTFKKWCDEYFFLTHRQEARGVGGIFFDDLETPNMEKAFDFVRDCASTFLPAYVPIMMRRKDLPYTEEEKRWQQLRRGRYVEFNLVHDRGTKFGLHTPGARIESIMCSMPLTARWEYDAQPAPGSREAQLVEVLRKPRDWLGATTMIPASS